MKDSGFLFFILLNTSIIYAGNNKVQLKFGFEAMTNFEQLPLLFPNGTETRQPLAYDPTGGNWDHNFEAAFTQYIDSFIDKKGIKIKEYVIFDEYGPGCLYRQQMNAWFDKSGIPNGWLPVGNPDQPRANATIRYYFDDEKEPRINMHLKDYFGTKIQPFTNPLCFVDSLYLFANSYYPLAFRKHLKVTLRPNSDTFAKMDTKWYQYTYLAFPVDTKVETWKGTEMENEEAITEWNNCGKNPNHLNGCKIYSKSFDIKNNDKQTVFELKNKGSIVGIDIKLNPYTLKTFYNTQLKIYWDNEKQPAVDMPVSSFFGGGGGNFTASAEKVFNKSLTTLLFGFDKVSQHFYSYWPMPFWKSAKIVIENNSGMDISQLQCDVTFKPSNEADYDKEKTGYFTAKRTLDADPDTLAFRNVAFSETGQGHVVGIMFYSDRYDMDGDEFTYIDDSQTPQIHGSGTEDDHNQGWAGRAYQKQLWGSLINGYDGAYRMYLNDSYVFNKNILITYEHSLMKKDRFPNGGTTDVVIYYYKSKTGENLLLTDEIDVGNHYSESMHQYKITGLTWKGIVKDEYDGYERNLDYGACTDDGKAFNGSSKFTVKINTDNTGVKLRKRINRNGNGLQKAEVYVDGKKVDKPWQVVIPSISTGRGIVDGWYDTDFEIPSNFTKGKSTIDLEIRYVYSPQKHEINEFYYRVYSYK